MDIGVLFLISYIIQFGLGAYAFFNMPARTKLEGRLRGMVLTCALLPCMFLSVIYQIGAIAVYRYRAARDDAATEGLRTSFDDGSSRTDQSQARRPENPFDIGGDSDDASSPPDGGQYDPDNDSGSRQSPPSDNPFM